MAGKIMKFMRVAAGYYQKDLAKKLNVTQGTLSGYEIGYSEPNFSVVEKIAQACEFQIRFVDLNSKEEYYLAEDGEVKRVGE